MKVVLLTTVKYGSGKYLHVGDTYNLSSGIPADVKKVLMNIKDNPALVRVIGMVSEPAEPSVEESTPSMDAEFTVETMVPEETAPLSRRA